MVSAKLLAESRRAKDAELGRLLEAREAAPGLTGEDVAQREPAGSPNIEWREFEERAGPAPPGFSGDYVSGVGSA
jgi:hypothetical protein